MHEMLEMHRKSILINWEPRGLIPSNEVRQIALDPGVLAYILLREVREEEQIVPNIVHRLQESQHPWGMGRWNLYMVFEALVLCVTGPFDGGAARTTYEAFVLLVVLQFLLFFTEHGEGVDDDS